MSTYRRGNIIGFILLCILIGGVVYSQYYILPHIAPIDPVPDGGTPQEEAQDFKFEELSFHVYTSFHQFLGTQNNVAVIGIDVTNLSNETIDDIRFVKMTVYWKSHDYNFTTEFTTEDGPLGTITLDPDESDLVQLKNFRTWPTGTPFSAYSGEEDDAYGRILVTFNTNQSYILTTNYFYMHGFED